MIKDSEKHLTLCGRTNSFKYIIVKFLISCMRLLRYLIYNRCLCGFIHNLVKSFKITSKKEISKVAGPSLQICLKNSFTVTSLRKYKLRKFESEAYVELYQTSKMERFVVNYIPKTLHLRCSIGFWIIDFVMD